MYQSLQGNLGLGKAIEYFTSQGITVALPLNDTQKFDLIADFNGGLQKISVKTSRSTKNGISFEVQLRNTGGSSGVCKVRPFDKQSCDYIFIYTINEECYLIPSNVIEASNSIHVGPKYKDYLVSIKPFKDFIEEQEA